MTKHQILLLNKAVRELHEKGHSFIGGIHCNSVARLLVEMEQEIKSLNKAAQPKWISVEERLPEDEVVAANFAPSTYGYKEYILGYVRPPMGTEPGGCYAINDYEILHNVTHWMPLPPTPNDNKEE